MQHINIKASTEKKSDSSECNIKLHHEGSPYETYFTAKINKNGLSTK